MPTPDHPFFVGQQVRIDSVNRRTLPDGTKSPLEVGTVVKIGRALVHVQVNSRIEKYEIDGRHAKDGYGHEWVLTEEELAEREHRDSLTQQLSLHGFAPKRNGKYPQSTEVLERVLRVLQDALDETERERGL